MSPLLFYTFKLYGGCAKSTITLFFTSGTCKYAMGEQNKNVERTSMFIISPDQRILTALKKTKDVTMRELSITSKVNIASLHYRLRKLESEGKVAHCYLKADDNRIVKHYRLKEEKGR